MSSKSRTKPSTYRLSEVARKVVLPAGVTHTGWPAVEARCRDLGVRFRPWQVGAGKVILAKRSNGKYAATIGGTGMSIPRQVGKTFLVGAIVFALCLLRPGLTVIWTAHRLRTAGETFKKMQGFARRAKVKPFIAKVVLGSGEEEIVLTNGSRILFGARERGFGRGFDEIDVLIFDEAQILTDAALDDMVPATNQSRQDTGALLLFIGTPPKPTDAGEVFTRMRVDASSGEDEDTGWVEFGADAGFEPTSLPEPMTEADWRQVAKANPSYPQDTPREAILRMRKKLSPESFAREGLGIWDEDQAPGIFPTWGRLKVDLEPDLSRIRVIGLAGSVDGEWGSIGSAIELEDDRILVGAVDRRAGHGWLVAEAKRIQDERDCDVVIDKRGPLSHLIPNLLQAGVRLHEVDTQEWADACGSVGERVRNKTIVHLGHPDLADAQRHATWRPVGDRRAFGRRSGDISMLEAVTLASYVTLSGTESVYESRGVLTL